jgi:SprB repeat
MKKSTTIKIASLLALFIVIFQFSCKHELPPVSCNGSYFKVTAASQSATLNQNNGSITATASGGEGFKYSLNGGIFQDSGYFSGLQPFQNYNLVGKNSIGCTDTVVVQIGSFNPCQGVVINVSLAKTDVTPGLTNGTVTATATGSTGFTYSINGGAFQNNPTFSNLAAGDYTVAAKSATGCIGLGQITVGTSNPCAGITVAVNVTSVQPTSGASNGSITAVATGGSGFTYSLNNGAFQASGTFSALAAGNYTITVKNSSGCTGVTTATLVGADPCAGVTVVVSYTKIDPTTGQSNGSITASATGGTGFTYSLNSGAYQASATFSGLATGNYTVTAKNSTGCTGITTVALGSTNPCAGVTVAVTTTTVSPSTGLSNGSITASATGGTGFTYSLNNGAYQASATFSNLAAGSYTITAKNSNGCTGATTVTLTATNPCAGVTVTVTSTTINPSTGLSNGSITASATGGTGFTYSLNNGAYQTSGTFTNLAAGTYTITAKNSNGCLGATSVTLTATSPCTSTTINLTAAVVNTTPCVTPANNGSITLTATGSTGFTYNINGGTYQASNVFANQNAGTYLMGVKDVNGCTKTLSVAVGVTASGPLFTSMRNLITTRCSGSGCHMNGTTTAGYNFDSDCSIVTYWNQINKSCVLYTLVKMPKSPQALLTTAEKAIITNWVNAGHRITD